MNINRRKLLVRTLGTVSLIGTSKVFATAEDVEAAIKAIAGDAEVTRGALTLTAPEIAENGSSVPIAVLVDGELTPESYVESIAIFADGNPNPEVITFNFTSNSGEAFAATRMRLAKTQNVVAVAKMNDGSVLTDTKNVKVTIGGCGG
jgi:sulfur-oxidizing protein SoxY